MKLEVVDAIKEYLVERSTNPFADSEYLIVGQRGVLQRDVINTMLEKLTLKPGIDVRLKPHTFRHTFILAMEHWWALLQATPMIKIEI